MRLNVILIACIVALILLLAYLLLFKKYTQNIGIEEDTSVDKFSIKYLSDGVRKTFDNILKANYSEMNLNKFEVEKGERNKSNLRKAKKSCAFGNLGSKIFMRDYVKDILESQFGVSEETINQIIPFDDLDALTTIDKFDVLLYLYTKKYELRGLANMISENHLDDPKLDESGDVYFEITKKEIESLFYRHTLAIKELSYSAKLDLVAQRIYQGLYGHGVIDEIINQEIDGVNLGVSGIPDSFYSYGEDLNLGAKDGEMALAGYNAIWLIFSGKKIRLSFLGFGSERELQRIIKNIYRYGDPGMLSADKGFIINCLQNGSRVTVSRPPMSEEWFMFLRNFGTADTKTLEELYPFSGNQKMINTAKWIIRGECNVSVTGTQGCGKTTFILNLIGFMRKSYAIRVQEVEAELRLRKKYPRRNIGSFTETNTVSSQQCIDFTKKTDADVGILGEVAEAPVAAIGIQMAQVGYRQLLFSHHAKTVPSLIKSFRDNLLVAGGYSNETIAEETVASVLNFDIHLERTVMGKRFVSRITEIIPRVAEPYDRNCVSASEIEFFYRMTDRQLFDYQDIVVFCEDDTYRFVNKLSKNSIESIESLLTQEEKVEFRDFLRVMEAEVDAFKAANPDKTFSSFEYTKESVAAQESVVAPESVQKSAPVYEFEERAARESGKESVPELNKYCALNLYSTKKGTESEDNYGPVSTDNLVFTGKGV